MQAILAVAFNILVVVFFFSLTIFVHELGHFLVARRLGFKVEAFSIGFGPALWKKTIDGIVYKIGLLPFGGYVALPQMDPTGQARAAKADAPALPPTRPIHRIAVALAGVTCNVILAFVLAAIIYWTGRPAEMRDMPARVGYVDTNGVLFAQGLRAGDRILAVGHNDVQTWEDVVIRAAMEPVVHLHTERSDGSRQTVKFEADSVEKTAAVIYGEMDPAAPVIVGSVLTNSAAKEVGLRRGDRILSIDGVELIGRAHMSSIVGAASNRPVALKILRDGQPLDLAVTPRYDAEAKRNLIGVGFMSETIHPSPLAEVKYAAGAVFRLLNYLATPRYTGRAFSAIGGAPEIIFIFWQMAKAGLIAAIAFAVTININLAIINLLPFMVLDGGHICLSVWEIVRGKPAGPRFVSVLWQAGAACLIALMLVLTVRGVFRIHQWTSEPELPPAAATSTNKP